MVKLSVKVVYRNSDACVAALNKTARKLDVQATLRTVLCVDCTGIFVALQSVCNK